MFKKKLLAAWPLSHLDFDAQRSAAGSPWEQERLSQSFTALCRSAGARRFSASPVGVTGRLHGLVVRGVVFASGDTGGMRGFVTDI